MEIARLRELLAEATPGRGPTTAFAFVTREDAALLDAARGTLPALLDRLEAAEAVVEAAREVAVFRTSTDGSAESAAGRLQAALRRYDEVPRG